MWRSMEEVLRGLKEEGILEEVKSEKTESGLPPGFRFHPTDEELITYYLASKVFTSTTNTTTNNNPANLLLSNYYSGVQIAEVDLTRCEPWDLPERAKMGEREWYLYSLRDRKYPSGLRTNRATETGYWKATGKDRQVYASSITTTPPASAGGGGGGMLIGMKKTLVFYQGRAPRGVKTKWVMHEYRLDGHFSSFRLSSKEEWVICRIFHKNGDKKNPAIMQHHPPLPLSPFLSTLPPLQELKTSTTTTTTQTLADNSLLHSLLSNPLTNFSSISGPDPVFPTTTTTTTTIATPVDLPWSASAAADVSATKQQQNWLDRICPQVQIQYFQHQHQFQYHDDHHHDPMNFDQTMDTHPHPNTDNYSATAVTSSDNHDEEDTQVDTTTAAVHVDVDVDVSPSFAVAALDRMLNHAINYHPAESWSFHYP